MPSLKLPKDLEDRLKKLAAETHKPKSFYIREALRRYLGEYEETFLTLARIESLQTPVSETLSNKEPSGVPTDRITSRQNVTESDNSRGRILVADDSTTNQRVALVILRKLGYLADGVANGIEAVNALQTIPYDLVLMDCQMPGMDGYETTKLIRKAKSKVLNHNIPIVAMTAHTTKKDRERCLKAGMNEHLGKPVEPDRLEEVLARWLTGQTGATAKKSPAGSRDKTAMAVSDKTKEVFNEEELTRRIFNDRELGRELLAHFMEDLPGYIDSLRKSLAGKDASGIERHAHTIKGAAANVAAGGIRELAFEMEQAGGRGELRRVTELFPRLEEELEQIKTILKRSGWL